MKGALLFIAIFALSMLMIPMIALGFRGGVAEEDVPVHAPSVPDTSNEAPAPELSVLDEPDELDGEEREVVAEASVIAGVTVFRILDESTGEVHTVSVRDYVRGAVAAEMPAAFHTEALRAQAVAAHTYALYNHYAQQQNPDPALQGADFSADPSNRWVYMTEETAREFWGERADEYWNKVCDAVDSVLPYVLVYDDEPIVAAYHAISAGRTEDAANVWTGSAPYLVPADSEGDLLAPDYESIVTVGEEELRALLLAAYPHMNLSEPASEWLSDAEHSSSGYVTAINVGGVQLHGKDLRTLLDLRSHNFDVTYVNNAFQFTVYGYGHGVGLSQYGADFLARQGLDFEEILLNYYAGVALCELDNGEDL